MALLRPIPALVSIQGDSGGISGWENPPISLLLLAPNHSQTANFPSPEVCLEAHDAGVAFVTVPQAFQWQIAKN